MLHKCKISARNLISMFTKKLSRFHRENKHTGLAKYLRERIKAGGPLTVAEYMRECLTNPLYGYYMTRDPISKEGDFITSPELSQIFGELIGIWVLNEWTKLGSPKPFHIIELGPGRGTLIADVMQVLRQFKATSGISLHLVEVSQHMSQLQASTLRCASIEQRLSRMAGTDYQSGVTADGVNVKWYTHIQDVQPGFSCIIAHEFFDALPIHKFQRTEHGWREMLVDIDVNSNEKKFRYIISRSPTPASSVFIKPDDERDHVEVCPAAGVIVQHIASRLEEEGGFMLIGDYGHYGNKTDTLRAFRNHKLHNLLVEPGSADLTADVDFHYIKICAEPKLAVFGPVTQSFFLKNMGIDLRLKVLLAQCSSEERKIVQATYRMLMDDNNMGQRFKFISLFPAVLSDHLNKFPVAGFSEIVSG